MRLPLKMFTLLLPALASTSWGADIYLPIPQAPIEKPIPHTSPEALRALRHAQSNLSTAHTLAVIRTNVNVEGARIDVFRQALQVTQLRGDLLNELAQNQESYRLLNNRITIAQEQLDKETDTDKRMERAREMLVLHSQLSAMQKEYLESNNRYMTARMDLCSAQENLRQAEKQQRYDIQSDPQFKEALAELKSASLLKVASVE